MRSAEPSSLTELAWPRWVQLAATAEAYVHPSAREPAWGVCLVALGGAEHAARRLVRDLMWRAPFCPPRDRWFRVVAGSAPDDDDPATCWTDAVRSLAAVDLAAMGEPRAGIRIVVFSDGAYRQPATVAAAVRRLAAWYAESGTRCRVQWWDVRIGHSQAREDGVLPHEPTDAEVDRFELNLSLPPAVEDEADDLAVAMLSLACHLASGGTEANAPAWLKSRAGQRLLVAAGVQPQLHRAECVSVQRALESIVATERAALPSRAAQPPALRVIETRGAVAPEPEESPPALVSSELRHGAATLNILLWLIGALATLVVCARLVVALAGPEPNIWWLVATVPMVLVLLVLALWVLRSRSGYLYEGRLASMTRRRPPAKAPVGFPAPVLPRALDDSRSNLAALRGVREARLAQWMGEALDEWLRETRPPAATPTARSGSGQEWAFSASLGAGGADALSLRVGPYHVELTQLGERR